jgi:Zn-dependent protease
MNNNIQIIIYQIVTLIPAFILALSFRGFFRALAAKLMGDDLPKREGFLTLNPLAHINFLGLLLILLILGVISSMLGIAEVQSFIFIGLILIGIRWSYVVPINVSSFKKIKLGMVLVALSGPVGEFVLALLTMYFLKYFPFKLCPLYVIKTFHSICQSTISLAIFFGVIHLIPLPPFDGEGILKGLAPASWGNAISWLESKSLFVFIIFIFFFDFFAVFINTFSLYIYGLLSSLVF